MPQYLLKWASERTLSHRRSDKRELTYMVSERYRSKDDYLHAHKSSEAFKIFRPIMKAMQDAGDVVVSGDSFEELGLGFT